MAKVSIREDNTLRIGYTYIESGLKRVEHYSASYTYFDKLEVAIAKVGGEDMLFIVPALKNDIPLGNISTSLKNIDNMKMVEDWFKKEGLTIQDLRDTLKI